MKYNYSVKYNGKWYAPNQEVPEAEEKAAVEVIPEAEEKAAEKPKRTKRG